MVGSVRLQSDGIQLIVHLSLMSPTITHNCRLVAAGKIAAIADKMGKPILGGQNAAALSTQTFLSYHV